MDETLPHPAIEFWFPPGAVQNARGVTGGLSGANIWRVRLASGSQWALRCWPEGVTTERVSEIHRVVRHAVADGCDFLPRHQQDPRHGRTALQWRDRVWDCTTWISGTAVDAVEDAAGIASVVGLAVARFHRCVASLGTQSGEAPAVAARIEQLQSLDRYLGSHFGALESALRDPSLGPFKSEIFRTAVGLLRVRWRQGAIAAASRQVELWRTRDVRRQYVFRDIHLGNCLFEGPRLSGIVDVDAIRRDTPAADLARLVGSIRMAYAGPERTSDVDRLMFGDAPDDVELLWRAALAAYRSEWAFSAEEEELARVLYRVNPLINLANWLRWILIERRAFPASDGAIAQRVEQWTRMVTLTPFFAMTYNQGP